MTYRFSGKKLTGIEKLKDAHKGKSAVICGSGTTLRDFQTDWVPEDWPLVAVNEAIGKLGERATYWVLSDTPIIKEYAAKCPKTTAVLAMHQATLDINGACPEQVVYTVNSMNDAKDRNNGYEFFSRGTVLIGAIEMMRWMGIRKIFCFGLDCYRTQDSYYYDGREPKIVTERAIYPIDQVARLKPGLKIWRTPRLKRMVQKLHMAVESGLWKEMEIFCVNSPISQQEVFTMMTLDEFEEDKARNSKRAERRRRRAKATVAAAEPSEGGDNGGGPETPSGQDVPSAPFQDGGEQEGLPGGGDTQGEDDANDNPSPVEPGEGEVDDGGDVRHEPVDGPPEGDDAAVEVQPDDAGTAS